MIDFPSIINFQQDEATALQNWGKLYTYMDEQDFVNKIGPQVAMGCKEWEKGRNTP